MKLLITGGTGFLGSHLARRLAAGGHDVTVLRRESSQTSPLDAVDVRYEIGDVGDASIVRRAADGQDVVIHAAAGFTGRGTRPECFEINVAGTRNVVGACIDARVRRLIHVSSIAAIGVPPDRTPANEDFAYNVGRSRLYYHASKHDAEVTVREGTARGLDAVIVNPGSLWGPFGDTYRGSYIVDIVRPGGRVRVSPGGVCVAHVGDVVEGITSAMDRGAAGSRYILGGDNLTCRELMTKIAAQLGVRPRLMRFPKIAIEPLAMALRPMAAIDPRFYGPYLRTYIAGRYTFYDSSKAAAELGYRPRSFDVILDECIRFSVPDRSTSAAVA
jgi:dihydroflavonol-4-reductase